MTEYLFTYYSLTQAQTGLHLLKKRGIAVTLKRTPRQLAAKGCGYSLSLREGAVLAASATLHGSNCDYNRLYRLRDGVAEEVIP